MAKKNKPKLISLFSGCGGLDLGFRQAGFDIVWANDFDSDAQAVYELNFGVGTIDKRDILTVGEDDIPEGDILTAGFPCQPFSNAGNRKGVHDSRGLLYKECLRIIKNKSPKVIVFENVKGLLSSKYLDGRNLADVIVEDLSTMQPLGYDVVYEIVNASDYGVPQNRQRVLFIGIRKDIGKKFIFPKKQSKNRLTVGDVLNQPQNVPNQVHWEFSPQALEMLEYIPEGGSWKDVPYEHLAPRFQRIRDDMKKYHSPKFYRRFGRNEICGTITASAQPENCGIIHPTENRRYTIREVARIQTFPDTFKFFDASLREITAMYKVIGNAVPSKLAKVIGVAIIEQVFKEVEFMNTDKAYLLGLLIGGGIFGNAEDVLRIVLPFNKWGSYEDNPKRAGQIAGDILQKVGQVFRAIYNLTVQYETTTGGRWVILCEGDTTQLRADLAKYDITCNGEIRRDAYITLLVQDLIDDNLKRRFIAGLADTIGSMAKSHRRFTDEIQIISFEIKGFNFQFVCDLCRLLYSVKCISDQILWNHPNFHSANDPYYTSWKKGFKLRIQLDQYAQFGAVSFRTKAESLKENRSLQHQTNTTPPCPERDISVTPTCVHPGEHDSCLPECIRGGHYIHNRHVCAVLGCQHAPYQKVAEQFSNIGHLITPFPILCKGTSIEINKIISENDLLNSRTYIASRVAVLSILEQYYLDKKLRLYSTSKVNGYPITEILQAIAFIIGTSEELAGKRPRGGYEAVIKKHIEADIDLTIEIKKPDILTPLIISGNGRAALVGALNPDVYASLVSQDPFNQYKLLVRDITEEDLR